VILPFDGPSSVRDLTEYHPTWLEVQSPKNMVVLAQLDLRESQAIALASEALRYILVTYLRAGQKYYGGERRIRTIAPVEPCVSYGAIVAT
jgi:hypothetical protein